MSDLKTPEQVADYIRRRLTKHWHTDLTGATEAFPHRVYLGNPSRQDLESHWSSFHDQTVRWHEWATTVGATLHTRERAVHRTRQPLPEYVVVEDLDTAATISGRDWPHWLIRNRNRLVFLTDGFPHADAATALRVTDKYSDRDFDTLLTVADWFNDNPGAAEGLTPRMVPLPGVHAKWLQDHRNGITALTGVTINDLIRHPPRIHFTYLDPDHRASGARIHDSATVGDAFTPAYQPRIVLISENKDTAINFPALAGAVAVEGSGRGGKTAAAFGWLREAPAVIYWGDIDKDGFEILNGYREDFDRAISAILMDLDTYAAYEPYGTHFDRHGNPIRPAPARDTPRLTDAERTLYETLLFPDHTGHRRVEQERIPLAVALAAVQQVALETSQ